MFNNLVRITIMIMLMSTVNPMLIAVYSEQQVEISKQIALYSEQQVEISKQILESCLNPTGENK